MGNSRKSPSPNKAARHEAARLVAQRFERALEAILARVVVSGDALALAYSGGLDSSLLLHLLAGHAQRNGRRLFAFHVHHGLSPHADDWLAHCAQQATALGVRFDAARVVLPDLAEHGVEQAARLARYQALSALCRRHQVSLLLTAHHQDDQAETVLLQLFRGAGLPGLSGMADAADIHPLLGDALALGRPLLGCRRSELASAAAQLGVAFIDDESNADTRYRRNAIRQLILPLIEAHFPGATTAMARSSRHWQAAQQLLDDLAAIDLAHCVEADPGTATGFVADVHGEGGEGEAHGLGALRLDRVAGLSVERIDNLLRYWLAKRGARRPPSEAQLVQLREQMLGAASDAHPSLDLGGLTLQRQGGRLVVANQPAAEPPEADIVLRWTGQNRIEVPEWQGVLRFERGGGGVSAERLAASVLSMRRRHGGERLMPAAGRPSRSLKNLYQEAGIPARQRAWLPLVYLDDTLMFAAGLGMDARHAAAGEGVRLVWQAGPEPG